MSRALLLLAALALPACAIRDSRSGGLPPDASALVVGRTTKAEALALLGPPHVVRRQFDGDLLVWRADRAHSERLLLVPFVPLYEDFEGEARTDLLALLFDRSGVLAGVGQRRDGAGD